MKNRKFTNYLKELGDHLSLCYSSVEIDIEVKWLNKDKVKIRVGDQTDLSRKDSEALLLSKDGSEWVTIKWLGSHKFPTCKSANFISFDGEIITTTNFTSITYHGY